MNDKMSKNILRFGKYKGKSFEYVRKVKFAYLINSNYNKKELAAKPTLFASLGKGEI